MSLTFGSIGGNVTAQDIVGGDKITTTTTNRGAKELTEALQRELSKPAPEQDKATVLHILGELKQVAPQIVTSLITLWSSPLKVLGIVWDALTDDPTNKKKP